MLDGNVLLRQKRDEVPEGTLSCPDRNMEVFHHYRHYEGLRLLPSACEQIIIQQTLNKHTYGRHLWECVHWECTDRMALIHLSS